MDAVFEPAPYFSVGSAEAPHEVEQFSPPNGKNGTCTTFAGPANMKCGIEADEWTLARALVRPGDAVLELGARYGTTSCALAAATKNRGHVVAVEPDQDAWPYLKSNQQRHRCGFAILRGVVGAKDLSWTPNDAGDGYGSSTSVPTVRGHSRRVPAMPLTKLLHNVGVPSFNVSLVDCEGCIEHDLTPEILHRLNLLLWEEDGPSPINNRRWYRRLTAVREPVSNPEVSPVSGLSLYLPSPIADPKIDRS